MKIGEREVIAEVLDGPDAEGWVTLLVRDCQLLTEHLKSGQFKPGTQMRRKAATVLRGAPARLKWSDEAARGSVKGSRFLANTVSGTSLDARDN